MGGVSWVEVAILDSRPLCEIIHNWFADGNVVVNKGDTCVVAVAAENRDTSEAQARRPDNLALTVGFDLDFFLLEGDELGINSYMVAFDWCLNVWPQDTAVLWLLVAFEHQQRRTLESKLYSLDGPVVVKQSCVQILFPRIVDGIAGSLDLVSQDGWYLPRRRKA